MKPWLKLYRRRSARFDALPMLTRGLFAELLAHTDDDGWIRLGSSNRLALWRYVGAHPRERRGLTRHLDELVALGSVEEHADGWLVPSFRKHQSGAQRTPNEHPTNSQRTAKLN